MKTTADFARVKFIDLSDLEKKAVLSAMSIRPMAYAPYSNYQVGAAVVSLSDRIYTGVNVEFVTLSGTFHAARFALAEMVKGGEYRFKMLVRVAKNRGVVPCHECRQAMREFSGDDLESIFVLAVGEQGGCIVKYTFADLGVDSFGPNMMQWSLKR